MFLRELQELRRKIARNITVKRHNIRDPKTIEDREQQQRLFRRLSERFELVRSADVPAPQPTWFPARHTL